LAEQAGYLPDMFGIGHWDSPRCKKFAELIVRECIDVVHNSSVRFTADQVHINKLARDAIQQHFGVKP
jgi:hypothetical protein